MAMLVTVVLVAAAGSGSDGMAGEWYWWQPQGVAVMAWLVTVVLVAAAGSGSDGMAGDSGIGGRSREWQ
jgi:uncharacterized membrane protein